jgi:hypothetical protein
LKKGRAEDSSVWREGGTKFDSWRRKEGCSKVRSRNRRIQGKLEQEVILAIQANEFKRRKIE